VNSHPLVSVIVPAYTCGRFLGAALESIFAQGHSPLQVIVVDDGSTDNTADVARSFADVTLIQQANGGLGAARNGGLPAARGEFVTWLDADDLWLPGKLNAELDHFAQHKATDMTLGHQRMFLNPGDPMPPWLATPREKVLSYSLYATAMRREVFGRVGLFNATLHTGEDFDWYMRAREAGVQLDILDQVLAAHRVRFDSITADAPRVRYDLLELARTSLRRRRARQAASWL
jgi:glycosyltransferase involved in cell wall biosynthesis